MAATSAAERKAILQPQKVIYCGACGMPPEYCEYGPDFETDCDPWLRKHHPDLHARLAEKRGAVLSTSTANSSKKKEKPPKPENPWTTEERLRAFYDKYVPEKVKDIPGLLEKYAGKEEKLFEALVKKYGEEPVDPYYSDSDDDEDEDDEDDDDASEEGGDGDKVGVAGAQTSGISKKKRRGASAKKEDSGGAHTRVVVQKVAQKKKRSLTIIAGMETVPGVKLKDLTKVFAKRFAGSSSVKENAKGEKEIIIQGDHMYDVAEMIVDKFKVPESAVFLDIEGEVVPLR